MTMKFSLAALLAALSSTSAFHLSALRAVSDPSSTLLRYKGSDFDDSFSNNNDNGGGDNFWSALVNTERWISDTLDRSNQAELSRQQQQRQNQNGQTMHFADEKEDDANSSSGKDNPYARKEVSYVCEIGSDLATVVGGIFRHVREARELGERHGRDVESRLASSSSSSDANPTTMRSTNVVVIPSCNELATFQTFDALVQSINQARRAARDFVVKKKDGEDDGTNEWV